MTTPSFLINVTLELAAFPKVLAASSASLIFENLFKLSKVDTKRFACFSSSLTSWNLKFLDKSLSETTYATEMLIASKEKTIKNIRDLIPIYLFRCS